MHEIASFALVLLIIYLLLAALPYLYQRRLIYHPVAVDPAFAAEEIIIRTPVLIAAAVNDREIPLNHTLAPKQSLTNTTLE